MDKVREGLSWTLLGLKMEGAVRLRMQVSPGPSQKATEMDWAKCPPEGTKPSYDFSW